MSKEQETHTPTGVRLPDSLLERMDKLLERMSRPGMRLTRTDALRMAAFEWVEREEGRKR